MSTIQIKQNLRPLKFAFVVKPGHLASLERVIEVNSFLWGSTYNPILPFYRRLPKELRDEAALDKGRDIFSGSLQFFQPDYLVVCGDVDAKEFTDVPCMVLELDQLTENIKAERRPGFGIGIPELLNDYYDTDAKFLRRRPITHYVPRYGRNHRCFLKSVFGAYPTELDEDFQQDVLEAFDAKQPDMTIQNYLQHLNGSAKNLHELSSRNIKFDYRGTMPRDRFVIYLLDPRSFIDVVSFLNLRAAGYSVLPIAKECSDLEATKEICLNFIERHSWVHPDNPHALSPVTLQKSPSIDSDELTAFYAFLSPPNFPPSKARPNGDWPTCLIRTSLPPFWSQFHWERGHVNCASLTVAKKEEDVAIREGRSVKFRSIAPDFLSDRALKTMEARYAVDIAIGNHISTDFEPGVIPPGSQEMARLFGQFGRSEWLVKRTGLTHFPSFQSSVFVNLPTAQEVFLGWLDSHGWKAELSSAGKIANEMLRHLDGPWHISMMQSSKFVELFSGHLFANGKSVRSGEFINRYLKEVYDDLIIAWGEDAFLKALLKSKVVDLGAKLQCDVCARRSWYSLTELDYTLKCTHCLSTFDVPSHNPGKIDWSYKTIGPFAASGRGSGAYCVLITARFFENRIGRNRTTTCLSFEAKKGDKTMEADLGIFYGEEFFFNRATETIFCECKTFNRFEQSDVSRMKEIASEFPNAMLVFATLNDDLSPDEKAIIKPLAEELSKPSGGDRPTNPIMILTGTELFSGVRPSTTWDGLDGKYKKFGRSNRVRTLTEICDATQQLYLDLPPWHETWAKEWERRARARKK